MKKLINAVLVLTAALFLLPGSALAQDSGRDFRRDSDRDFGREYRRDQPRGEIQVQNNWRDTVEVTMWTHQRERIGDAWEINPGQTVYLLADGIRIKARPNYKIKVGDDWGWVNLGDVGEFRRGRWHVRVRDIWQATHQRGDRRDRRDSRDENTPDWKR